MIKDLGKRTAVNDAALESILNEMILDATKDPAYTSPYIRTSIISYANTVGTWSASVELNAEPDPTSLNNFVNQFTKSWREQSGYPVDPKEFRMDTSRYLEKQIIVEANGFRNFTGSIEHQPSPTLSIRCSITMIHNKP
ncbi:hypothetical protein D3C71_1776400 [compost metagenome]